MVYMIDLHTYDGVLFQLVAGIGFYWVMLFFHELGHLKTLHHYGFSKAKVTWEYAFFAAGEEWMYNKLNDEQANGVYVAGILAGAPILLLYSIMATWPFVLMLSIIYFAGCWNDLKNIRIVGWDPLGNDD